MTNKRARAKPTTKELVRVYAKALSISRKRLEKMIKKLRLRVAAERIVHEEVDNLWDDTVDRARAAEEASKK